MLEDSTALGNRRLSADEVNSRSPRLSQCSLRGGGCEKACWSEWGKVVEALWI